MYQVPAKCRCGYCNYVPSDAVREDTVVRCVACGRQVLTLNVKEFVKARDAAEALIKMSLAQIK